MKKIILLTFIQVFVAWKSYSVGFRCRNIFSENVTNQVNVSSENFEKYLSFKNPENYLTSKNFDRYLTILEIKNEAQEWNLKKVKEYFKEYFDELISKNKINEKSMNRAQVIYGRSYN